MTRTTRPSTAAASSETDTRSYSPSTTPRASAAPRGRWAPRSPRPRSARRRSRARSWWWRSVAGRDRGRTPGRPRRGPLRASPSPRPARPRSAPWSTLTRSSPSTSTVIWRACRTTMSAPSGAPLSSAGTTRSRSPTSTPSAPSTSPTVRPNAETVLTCPSTSRVRVLCSVANAVVPATRDGEHRRLCGQPAPLDASLAHRPASVHVAPDLASPDRIRSGTLRAPGNPPDGNGKDTTRGSRAPSDHPGAGTSTMRSTRASGSTRVYSGLLGSRVYSGLLGSTARVYSGLLGSTRDRRPARSSG